MALQTEKKGDRDGGHCQRWRFSLVDLNRALQAAVRHGSCTNRSRNSTRTHPTRKRRPRQFKEAARLDVADGDRLHTMTTQGEQNWTKLRISGGSRGQGELVRKLIGAKGERLRCIAFGGGELGFAAAWVLESETVACARGSEGRADAVALTF